MTYDIQQAVKDAVLFYGAKWGTDIWSESEKGPVPDCSDNILVGVSVVEPVRGYGPRVWDPEAAGSLLAYLEGTSSGPHPLMIRILQRCPPGKVSVVFDEVERQYPDRLTLNGRIRAGFTSFWSRFQTVISDSLRSARSELSQAERNIMTIHRRHVSLSRLHADLLRPRGDDEVKQEIDLILALGVPSFDENSGKLVVVTKPIVLMDEDRGDEHEMGTYRVEIEISEGDISIFPHKSMWEMEGHYHPHVAADGDPCFGNVGERIRGTLALGRVGQACVLIKEFLESYNEGGAYRPINREDDRESRYESCYENSGLRDCVECADDNCPYHDDAASRCYESREDPKECISCRVGDNCSYYDRAVRRCWREAASSNEPWVCAHGCEEESCPHYGDTDNCSNEEICPKCDREDCPDRKAERRGDPDPDQVELPVASETPGGDPDGRCAGCEMEMCERRTT